MSIWLFSFLLFFLLANFVFILSPAEVIARDLEITYPAFGNIAAPERTDALLPDYVKYIFNLVIALSGLIVFGVIVFSGVQVIISSQNPTALGEAKSRIMDAIIGLVIIFGSYLLLTTINPQLVLINPILSGKEGLILYKDSNCPGGSNPQVTNLKPGTDYLKLGTSSRTLEGLNDQVKSIYFYRPGSELEVRVYPQQDWEGDPQVFKNQTANSCLPYPNPAATSTAAKSIELRWQNPGVYLCTDSSQKKCAIFSTSQSKLPGEFNDKVGYIKFKNTEEVKYGAILHENYDYAGQCRPYFGTTNPEGETVAQLGNGVSAITVFIQSNELQGKGVTLYEYQEYNTGTEVTTISSEVGPGQTYETQRETGGQKTLAGTIPVAVYPRFDQIYWDNKNENLNDQVRSIKIDGNYLVALFRDYNYGGECELFGRNTLNGDSDPNLESGNPVVDCSLTTKVFRGGNCDGVSSLKIIPVKK